MVRQSHELQVGDLFYLVLETWHYGSAALGLLADMAAEANAKHELGHNWKRHTINAE